MRIPRLRTFLIAFAAPALLPLSGAGQPADSPRSVRLADERLRDSCIWVDREDETYYLVSSAGRRGPNGRPAVVAYTSKNLESWHGPQVIFEVPEGFWAQRGIWAPELHAYQGRYYLFLTFNTDDPFPEQWREWLPRVKRGSQVLVGDSPSGPFEPFANRSTLPPDMMTLDGTLWVEDDIPYMVFCHEWVQIKDGTMQAIRLTEDLSETVGEPTRLFHGSDAPWNTKGEEHGAHVTDGPWLHVTQTGKLVMLWSGYDEGRYTTGIAVSTSGKLAGPWEQQTEPLFTDDGGHPMLFRRLDGQLMLALHQPNRGEERARLFEVDDSGDTVRIAAAAGNESADASEPVPIAVSTEEEPMQSGPYEPTWESLAQYDVPDWFRDAKFGIWAHWGPQCQPEEGDWYGRGMYQEGSGQYRHYVEHYGHPSQFGFKDVIHSWKAEKWDPDRLVALYKRAGAQYFFAMANHHDNLDLWDSEHQPWNSVAVGPKKNIIAGWADAARKQGLRFGVSVHAAHAWSWYEPAQGADKTGEFAGVPYDGTLTEADGRGQWWEGLDPQDLYAQDHVPSPDFDDPHSIHARWNWGNGASVPDTAYCEKFYNRSVDLISTYRPDLVYFDDTGLPLWPISDVGLKIAAHYYNSSARWNAGTNQAVLFGKILTPEQRECLVWDVERGAPNRLETIPWQTCTCIGNWHYSRDVYASDRYKSARTVIHMLADIVSKNGNLLLSIPVRGDGSIDEKEEAVLEGIAAWMDQNRESIIATRPWVVFGEGPATDGASINAQGFNEGKGKPFTAEDFRFTTKGDVLYAIQLGVSVGPVQIRSLGKEAGLLDRPIESVGLLGAGDELDWRRQDDALRIEPPPRPPNDIAPVYRIRTGS